MESAVFGIEITFGELGDEELVVLAKRGERAARNALFFRHERGIRGAAAPAKRLLRSMGGGDGSLQPEDIDQQAFLVFCKLVDEWEPGRVPFAPYLKSKMPWQLLHYVRDSGHYRSHRVGRLPTAANDGTREGVTPPAQEPISEDRAPVDAELEASWREYTSPLHGAWKRWVDLRYYHGLSSKQIAALTGRSRRSVDRDLQAAVSLMRASIQEDWEGV